MAQNPQERSQPSAILTYAHGTVDFGRGRFSRSNSGSGVDDTGMSLRAAPLGTSVPSRSTGVTLNAWPNPATWSTSGSSAASSSP